jgi:predicted acylesterase/phospholipase RssA
MINRDAAVVLSGGGAYAAYEIGVMKALLLGESAATGFQPLEPGIFTGTSAVNAALMVSRSGEPAAAALQYLESVWLNDFAGNPSEPGNGVFRIRLNPIPYSNFQYVLGQPSQPFFDLAGDLMSLGRTLLQRGTDFALSTGSLESRAVKFVDLASIISTEPFQETLRRVVNLDDIQASDRLLRIATTNWQTGEVTTFGNQDFSSDDGYNVLQASSAIPGIFSPVPIGTEHFVDGGLVMNTPLKPAIKEGATELHIIYLDPKVENIPLTKLQNTLDTFDRSLAISFATKANQDIDNLRWINDGLDALANINGSTDPDREMEALMRTVSRVREKGAQGTRYRKLTLHRYHPEDDLGDGLGILDFSVPAIQRLIQRGFEDGVRHSCKQSGCILGN